VTSVGVGGTGVAVGGCGGWIGVAVGSGETPLHPASNKVTCMIPINRCSFLVFILVSLLARNVVVLFISQQRSR
jgi:hypothetical protein